MKKQTLRNAFYSHQITILIALFFATIINLPVYAKIYHVVSAGEVIRWVFLVSVPVFFFCALIIIFSLFTWPYLTKLVFIPIILLSSIVSYSSYHYGTLFDDSMIVNIFQTDYNEATSYLNISFVTWFISVGVIPSIVLYKVKITKDRSAIMFLLNKIKVIMCSVVIIFFIALFYYKDYASIGRNNSYLKKMIIPNEFVYSTYKYIKHQYFTTPIVYREIGRDAIIPNADQARKPKLVIMVVGETARAQNYLVNGYVRNTTPFTEDKNVYSFKNVSSCGTATAISVPCMFSALNRSNYDHDIANSQDNVLDILQRAGVDVLWKDNDGGDKKVAKHVIKKMAPRSDNNDFCDGTNCFDEVLLNKLAQDIKPQDQLIILHFNGSHGPTYFKRYPKMEHEFTPTCDRSDIENCSTDQIVNTYDNTILYTDLVLSKIISKLKNETQHSTAMFYISDHGESLGEDGLYLHGMPYSIAPKYQKTVPMMLWMSNDFKKDMHISTQCLQKLANKNGLSQDYVFHTILSLLNVKTEVYNPSLDLLSTCKTQ
ncbi:phosphoethanolamine--lipid A transferase [Vibrio sp. S11_S32]|uniref:phosphoethanolamine transferase n=1 Tax=Vibrio sp. S11_S32 TaxID=2720225 RepID=UPI00167FF614|nr:phosphoethanolamine--lipid A transferase [Vibrio sp. S11_S32]MBD1577560.1 phosphoethanolamine--lipid A transferase [Vibrio sp. S11_S32]